VNCVGRIRDEGGWGVSWLISNVERKEESKAGKFWLGVMDFLFESFQRTRLRALRQHSNGADGSSGGSGGKG
jgi:hypothetical protein